MFTIQNQALPHVAPANQLPNIESVRRDNLQSPRIPRAQYAWAFSRHGAAATGKERVRPPPTGTHGACQPQKDTAESDNPGLDAIISDDQEPSFSEQHGHSQQHEAQAQALGNDAWAGCDRRQTEQELACPVGFQDIIPVGNRCIGVASTLKDAGRIRRAQQGIAGPRYSYSLYVRGYLRPEALDVESGLARPAAGDSGLAANVIASRYQQSSQPLAAPAIERFA